MEGIGKMSTDNWPYLGNGEIYRLDRY